MKITITHREILVPYDATGIRCEPECAVTFRGQIRAYVGDECLIAQREICRGEMRSLGPDAKRRIEELLIQHFMNLLRYKIFGGA